MIQIILVVYMTKVKIWLKVDYRVTILSYMYDDIVYYLTFE